MATTVLFFSSSKLTETETVNTDGGPVTLVTQYTYDDKSRLIGTIQPDGRTTHVIYNQLGKRDSTIDAEGRTTEYTYDDGGNLIRTDYFDGTFETFTYDGAGNKLGHTDRWGRTKK